MSSLCYTCAVCASNNDGAIVGPTQLTEPRCDCSQCSILQKLNPPTKSDLVQKKTDLRIFRTRQEIYFQLLYIMPAYAPMLEGTYYYASITCQCLLLPRAIFVQVLHVQLYVFILGGLFDM